MGNILTTHNVSQSFGAFDVFSGVTVKIEADARIGLVGPNGIGKTSLLLILSRLEQPSEGSVSHVTGLRLGYLRQEAMQAFEQKENTVYEEMLTVFAGIQEQEDRMRELETLMAEDYSDEVMEEYGAIQEQFERIGGYDYETRIRETLGGLGFHEEQYGLQLSLLSGGQKTRALLARLLLERPDLLILDEPTNHLDVNAVEWLERTLRGWKGALLVVSHDRYFLDSVVSTIWDLSRIGIESYSGNYSAYIRQRTDREGFAEKVYEQEKERLLQEMDYIKRNIARASTNGMAVGRLRRLSRDLFAIQEVGLMQYKQSKKWSDVGVGSIRPMTVAEAEQAIKGLENPVQRLPKFGLRLKSVVRSGDIVLRTRDLNVGYLDNPLFHGDNILLQRGECAALIGKNGTGKTTLLKTIMGEFPPLNGEIIHGAGLKIGYFAQAHDALDPENTVIDELMRHKKMNVSEARHHLAMYLFRRDDVFKKVSMLSGGERGKLAMAILALQGANFLLLDEPTNHLDIAAQESLQDVLEAFEGTILLVSHDRYLVNRLATQIWNVEDGHLHIFAGTYQEFLEDREKHKISRKEVFAAQKKQIKSKSDPAVTKLETQINSLEGTIRELENLMERASHAQRIAEVERLSLQHSESQQQLESLLERWTELA